MDLAALPFRTTRYPGVGIHFYSSDERTGRVVALIAMAPGHGYPRHQHRGAEEVLVVQGAYRDEDGIHRQGEYVRYENGSAHAPVAVPGDETCILLAVSHEGVTLLGG